MEHCNELQNGTNTLKSSQTAEVHVFEDATIHQMLIENRVREPHIQSNYMHFFHHHRHHEWITRGRETSELGRINLVQYLFSMSGQFSKQAGIIKTMKRCNNLKCMRYDGISMQNMIVCYKSILLTFWIYVFVFSLCIMTLNVLPTTKRVIYVEIEFAWKIHFYLTA